MIVMKFGGSSLKNPERIRAAGNLVLKRLDKKPIVVCSALGPTTDLLIELGNSALESSTYEIDNLKTFHLDICKELKINSETLEPLLNELTEVLRGVALLRELSPKSKDYVVSFGERLAVRIVTEYLNSQEVTAKFHEAWDLGLHTDAQYGNADVLPESYDNINANLGSLKTEYDYTPVITGYIAKTLDGHITTLGRSGTDLTASIIGAALKVQEIQLWKDVDGIMTTDPRITTAAQSIPQISFEEASELAYFGAQILHPLSIQPAMRLNIPVRVKNSYNPDHPGTEILGVTDGFKGLVKAITCKRDITLVDIVSTRMLGQHGFLARVFEIFSSYSLSVDMVATSEISVSLTLNRRDNLELIIEKLNQFAKVQVSHGKAILSLIGNVERSSEILDAAFNILKENNINVQMISQGASKVNIGLIVEDREIELCIAELHKHFFENVLAA